MEKNMELQLALSPLDFTLLTPLELLLRLSSSNFCGPLLTCDLHIQDTEEGFTSFVQPLRG